MHLGLVCNEYPPLPHGGIGSSNQDLAEGLGAAGHQVTVVGLCRPQYAGVAKPHAGLKVVRLAASPRLWRTWPSLFLDRWRLRRWLRQQHARRPFDLIESSDYEGWLPWGGPEGVPVICRLQGSNEFFDTELGRKGDVLEYKLERQSLAKAGFWIGLSRYVFSKTLPLCGLKEHPGTVIHHAVDAEFFSPGPADRVEPGLIVFANSINPKKGIEQLVDAMNIVCAAHQGARLAVLGQDAQRKENGLTYVERLQQRLRPEFRHRVVFTGRLDRRKGVLDYLRQAQVCCYPSHMETFGVAVIEAMAVAKPTIFSRTGPGPEVVEDNVSGLLCNPRSAEDIAAKILLLLNDPVLGGRLGESGRQRVLHLFDLRSWIPKNLEVYQNCLADIRSTWPK